MSQCIDVLQIIKKNLKIQFFSPQYFDGVLSFSSLYLYIKMHFKFSVTSVIFSCNIRVLFIYLTLVFTNSKTNKKHVYQGV